MKDKFENLANQDIRKYAKKNGVKMWEIADYKGVSEMYISRKFRHELSESEKEMYMQVIDLIASVKGVIKQESESIICPHCGKRIYKDEYAERQKNEEV